MQLKTFHVVMVKFQPTGNGTDIEPVMLWDKNVTMKEALKMFLDIAEKYPDAAPDAGSIDSVAFTDENGNSCSLFVSD